MWERCLRQALAQVEGLPVLVTSYGDLLTEPVGLVRGAGAFLVASGLGVVEPSANDVLAFVDPGLRHAESTPQDLFDDADVSGAQREFYAVLERVKGRHERFLSPALPRETPATEGLLAEHRRLLWPEHEQGLLARAGASRYLAPLRRAYARARKRRRKAVAPSSRKT